jgi:hypothetical protein
MAKREQAMGIPARISKGGGEKKGRHRTLFDYGLKLRGLDTPAAEIIKELRRYNMEACEPPITKYDFDRLAIAVIEFEFTKPADDPETEATKELYQYK